jgi:hypothetical protein
MSLIEGFEEAVKSRVLKRMEKLKIRVFSIVNARFQVPLLCDLALCYMLAGERETASDYLREASSLKEEVCVYLGFQDYVVVLIRTQEGDVEYVKKHIRTSPYLSQDSPIARALEKLVMLVPQGK